MNRRAAMKKFLVAIIAAMLALTAVFAAGCESPSPGMVTLDTWFFTSGVRNNLITVTSQREDVSFVLTTEKGVFWSPEEHDYCKQVTLSADETATWQPLRSTTEIELDFVEIIVKENDKIIGYAVIKITQREGTMDHAAEVLKASYFSSPVTQEYVEGVIKKIKDKNS